MWQAHHQRWELKSPLNRRCPFLTFDLKIILKQEGFHNINMSNLKYRIYSVSSENDQFPASNLQEMGGIWQSQHNCTYPQELTVQFFVPIQTKCMKLLFHQYKIPKMIEVFIKCGRNEKYRKLGYIQPNDNVQSQFVQKQLMTVRFEFPCTFVKLIFHQNYANSKNIFSQVALSDLLFEGELLPTSQYKNLEINVLDSLDTSSDDGDPETSTEKELSEVKTQKKPSALFTSVLFPEIFERFEQIKKEAVEKEEFQKASYIKNSILNFQQLQKQILRLEQLKKIALQEEDYDRCHKLKIQISKKKESASYQIKQFQNQIEDSNSNALTFSRANQIQQNRSNFHTSRENRLDTEERIPRTPAVNRNISPNNAFQEHESQVVPALRNKKNVEQSYLSNAKGNQSILDTVRSPTTAKKQETDQGEQSVDMRTYDIHRVMEQFPKLEQLEFKKFKKYEQFFDYIRIDLWRMILSNEYQKNWQLKSMALDEVMSLPVVQGKQLIAIMQFVAVTIGDKHTVNVKKSMQLLQKLINLPNKDIWCDPNYPRFFVDDILATLIQLMNDTKQEFRKMAVEIYKNLPLFSLVYLETSIKTIIKKSPSSYSGSNKNKRKQNPRLQTAKLAVIEYYLSTFTDALHHLNEIIKWLAQCANDPTYDVKMTATQMLLQIARMDKDLYAKIKQQLLRESKSVWNAFQLQYTALMSEIQSSKLMQKMSQPAEDSIDIHKKQTMKSKNKNSSRVSQSKVENSYVSASVSKQNEDVELAYSQQSGSYDRSQGSHDWFASNTHEKNNEQRQIRVMEPYEDEIEGMCDYCYKKYEQDNLNDHLLNYCTAIIHCMHCKCAIYIRQFTQHLLTACDKKKHQQCPRCLLAYQFDEINEHVARKFCRKSKSNMERCQFCEQDLEPDDVSWAEHSQKCEKIARPARHPPNYDLYTQNSEIEKTDR